MRVTFEKAYLKYLAYIKRRGFSEGTIHNRGIVLTHVFHKWYSKNYPEESQDYRSVTPIHIDEFIDSLLVSGIEKSTIRSYQTCIKAFFLYLHKEDIIRDNPVKKMVLIKVPGKEVVYFSSEHILKVLDDMFTHPDKNERYNITLRNYFIIRCAFSCGWRASEALACNPREDIDWDTGMVHLRKTKGNRDDFVYFDMETIKQLKQWYFSNYPNGNHLFYSIGGQRKGKPMLEAGYWRVFQKYFGKGSHRIRASFATHLVFEGVDLQDVQKLLRHKSIATTLRYVGADKSRIMSIHQQKNPFSAGTHEK